MKTILAVDREERERQLLVEELEAEGYHVVAVASAKEALAIARRRMPDLVILELALPHANGIELIGRLIGINRKLPIIIHSACASYQENFMCWLADAYILKSAGFGELMAAIDRLLLGTAPDSLASPSFCYNGAVVATCRLDGC
jgi:DNA-binding response OmpR family regulator